VDFVVESFLPDPTAVLSSADSVDELVLIMNTEHAIDKNDLLVRISCLRRRINSIKAKLLRKEFLLQQLVMPVMRQSFVAQRIDVIERYEHALSQVVDVAKRLKVATDVVHHANATFLSTIDLRMAQSSQTLSRKVEMLNTITTIVIPMNAIVAVFSMNVLVPYQNDQPPYQNYNAFSFMMSLFAAWVLLWAAWLTHKYMRLRKESEEKRKVEQTIRAAFQGPTAR
jgi:Mg2+ and Co2+ transporter CorA